jgi:hypothetical protein
MNEKTTVSIEINKNEIELKSRRESKSPSGWAVIAFTPACSLRSARLHIDSKLTSFATAVAATVGSFEAESVETLKKAITSITFDHDA